MKRQVWRSMGFLCALGTIIVLILTGINACINSKAYADISITEAEMTHESFAVKCEYVCAGTIGVESWGGDPKYSCSGCSFTSVPLGNIPLFRSKGGFTGGIKLPDGAKIIQHVRCGDRRRIRMGETMTIIEYIDATGAEAKVYVKAVPTASSLQPLRLRGVSRQEKPANGGNDVKTE